MASENELHNGQRRPGWVLATLGIHRIFLLLTRHQHFIIKHQLVNCIRWCTLEHPHPQNKHHILNGTNLLISLLTGALFQWPFNPLIITKECLFTPEDSRSNRNLVFCSMQLIRKRIGYFLNFYLNTCLLDADSRWTTTIISRLQKHVLNYHSIS